MTVNISKPAINVREKLAELDKPTGIAGQAMLAAETPQEQFNLIGAGRRNLIINGDFRVSQRGTSETGVGAVIKYANAPDRVKYVSLNSAGTHAYTISQSTTAPDGFSHSYKLDCTTADTSLASNVAVFLSISAMEGQNLQQLSYGTSNAKYVTLSFYVRSNKTGTYVAEVYNADAGKHIGQTYTISSSNTWEKKTLTFAGDTASAFDKDNARSLEVLLWLAAGSDFNSGTTPKTWASLVNANRCAGQTVNLADDTANEIYFTGVQLELGKVATPFEHRSYGEELALCQRYYYKHAGFGTNEIVGTSISYDSDSIFVPIFFPVTMRAGPTFLQETGNNYFKLFSNSSSTSFTGFDSYQETTRNGTNLFNNGEPTGMTGGYAGWVRLVDSSALIAFDAEL